MAIQWSCSCGQELLADDQHAGRKVRCPVCKRILAIPGSRPDATGAVVARRMGDEDEDEDDDRARRGGGLSNRDRLARARIGLGLHWGKSLCFTIIAGVGLLIALVVFIVTLTRGVGGPFNAIMSVLGCLIAVAFFVMPILGAVGSLLCFWLPVKSGGRVLSMVAFGLDTAAILMFAIMFLMLMSAGFRAFSPDALLEQGQMAVVVGILGVLLLLSGWILHMLVLRALSLYVRDRYTAGSAVRMLIAGLIVLIVPAILMFILNLTLMRTGKAGLIISEILLICYYGGLLAVAFKVLNLTATVRHLL